MTQFSVINVLLTNTLTLIGTSSIVSCLYNIRSTQSGLITNNLSIVGLNHLKILPTR